MNPALREMQGNLNSAARWQARCALEAVQIGVDFARLIFIPIRIDLKRRTA